MSCDSQLVFEEIVRACPENVPGKWGIFLEGGFFLRKILWGMAKMKPSGGFLVRNFSGAGILTGLVVHVGTFLKKYQ